jgi:hypothetical protein
MINFDQNWGVVRHFIILHTDRRWKAEISHRQAVEGRDFTLTGVGRLHTDRPTTHTILKRK